MRRATFQRYVIGLGVIALGGLTLVVGINLLVNPLNLYNGLRLAGFNDYKYELYKYMRQAKATEVRRQAPDCLVLGSSRAQAGLDPSHPAWLQCRGYNLAQNGGTLYEALRYYQHAAAVRTPREVVLALDLLMFNVYRPLRQPGFDEDRLLTRADGSPNPDWRRRYAVETLTSLAAWKTLTASYATVFPGTARRARGPEDGYWEYTWRDPAFLARRGHRGAFRRNEEAFLTTHWFPPPQHRFATRDPQTGVDIFDNYRDLLRRAHRDRTRLHLLVSPAHARQWEALDQAGLWNEWEEWKRQLARINEDEARRAGQSPFPLWDFSGYNAYTTEAVPPENDRETRMRWYWESSHFRKELGNRVLDRVFGYRAAGREQGADFGVRLDVRTIEMQLAAVRRDRARWRAANPQEVAEVADIARRTESWRR